MPGILERLQTMDERLSIDDFGTGYSSLVYLQRLPVVEIKADRSFVMTMCSVKDDAVIVRSIIDLAHNLGVKVVAEGVEDEATMDLLNEYGCDAGPGLPLQPPAARRRAGVLARQLAARSAAAADGGALIVEGVSVGVDDVQGSLLGPAEPMDPTPRSRRPCCPP